MASREIMGEWEHKSHLQSFTAKRKLLLNICPYLLLLLHKPHSTIQRGKDSKETSLLNSWGSDRGRTEQRNQGRLPHLYLWRDRTTVPKWTGSPCTKQLVFLLLICCSLMESVLQLQPHWVSTSLSSLPKGPSRQSSNDQLVSLCTLKLLSQLAKAESVTFKNVKLIVGCLQPHPQTSLSGDANVLLGLAVSFSPMPSVI